MAAICATMPAWVRVEVRWLFRQDTARAGQHKHGLSGLGKNHRFYKGEGYTKTLLPLPARRIARLSGVALT